MAGFRYEKVESEGVCVVLTESQARALGYVLQRAQEDVEFFTALTGTANRQAVSVLRSTMTQVQNRIVKGERELAEHQRRKLRSA